MENDKNKNLPSDFDSLTWGEGLSNLAVGINILPIGLPDNFGKGLATFDAEDPIFVVFINLVVFKRWFEIVVYFLTKFLCFFKFYSSPLLSRTLY